MYSTIKKKHCKCSPDCDKWPTLSCFGYYYAHLPEPLAKKAGTRRQVQIKNQNARKAAGIKLRADVRKTVEYTQEQELELYFKVKMNTSERVCENCGISLAALNDWAWRGSQHHPLDKALFPSVMSNPINHLVIGYYCCHQQIHTSVLNASKMDIFPKVKEIVVTLFPLLTDEEKRKCRKLYSPYIPNL